ncbi:PLAT/LH2 domain-containing protein [Streptomyces sp. NPDC047981]|uniref:PLAT/LH2 domain-containing protein n=1 Tax=Streptomyces sp. NPDC047981 TaxID=3154610 RepID=UPI003424D153
MTTVRWNGPDEGARNHGQDPEATEVLPRAAGSWTGGVPLPDAPVPEVASTRPLPRIEAEAPGPYTARAVGRARPAATGRRSSGHGSSERGSSGRGRKGVWAGAVLVACAAGGLTVGALTSGSAGPDDASAGSPGPAGPATAPAVAPPSPGTTSAPPDTGAAGAAVYRVTLTTPDTPGAGTDSDVQARLTDEAGRTSAWTVLDTADHNDFEAGARDTYVISVAPEFGRPASFQLWKGGRDAWAVESAALVTGPDGYAALWRPTDAPTRLWLTGGEQAPADGAPAFAAYSPEGALAQGAR